jgi:AP-3 complex subunit mu
MISALYLMSTAGEVIIDKQFASRIPRSCLEEYWSKYAAPLQDIDDLPGVLTHSRFAFIQIRREDVLLIAVATQEVPPLMILELLDMVANILCGYFKEINEESVRENFSLVYQILEEVFDFGYPLTTEEHILHELVLPPTLENKVRTLLDAPSKKRSGHDHNTVPWRGPDIKYTTNEIFFDIVEYLDCIMDVDGGVVRANVRGVIEASAKLSGMPDLILRLHGMDVMEDVAYHRCVRHARYETDRAISFVPPDGKFNLFQYRCRPLPNLQPPFYVTPQVTYHNEGGRINIMVGARHGLPSSDTKEKEVHRLTLVIPLPPHVDSVNISSATHGSHAFDSKSKKLTWKIGQLPTSATPSLSGEFSYGKSGMAAAAAQGSMQGTGESVSVYWQVPNYAISGVKVDTVNVLNESYKPYKGVKYMTKAGQCIIRMA